MPFEKSGMCPIDCCKAPNRVTNCDNCFGLCGPPTGDPKIYEFLALQPKNAQAFVDEFLTDPTFRELAVDCGL